MTSKLQTVLCRLLKFLAQALVLASVGYGAVCSAQYFGLRVPDCKHGFTIATSGFIAALILLYVACNAKMTIREGFLTEKKRIGIIRDIRAAAEANNMMMEMNRNDSTDSTDSTHSTHSTDVS